MFTGLVEGICRVDWVRPRGLGRELSLRLGELATGVKVGDSIALSGACSTVERLSGPNAVFYLGEETLARTWFSKDLHTGTRLNVERALPVNGRFEGHIVQGHVDATARVMGWDKGSAEGPFTVKVPDEFTRYLVAKGSVTLDGISLTVATLAGNSLTVSLIPHTADRTTLAEKTPGDLVNLETDILARYVEKLTS